MDIVSGGSSGVILAWRDDRSVTKCEIYAQRLNASGVPAWPVNGVPVTKAPGSQIAPSLVTDGTGGAKFAWMDGKLISRQQLDMISELPSREVLLAKLLGTLIAVPTQFVTVLSAVPRGGQVVLIGLANAPASFVPLRLVREGISVQGSIIYDHPHDFKSAIDLVARGVLKPARIVTDTFAFDEITPALTLASKGQSGKVLLQM